MSFLRAAAMTCLVLSLSGAELNLQSAGWSEHAGKDAKAVFTRIPGQVSISVAAGRYARMQAASPGDGTDAAPLRVETRLSITGEGALLGQAGQLTLIWPGGLLSVGVIPGDGAGRSAVARWVSSKERGERLGSLVLNPHAAPAFLRLVVSTRDVSAWASADGWTWQRLVALPREGGAFAGPPSTVAVGKGWPDEKQGLSLDVEQAEPAQASIGTYIFQGLRAVNDAAVLPSALLKTYTKGASREETIDQLRAASLPREWWLTGPFPARAVSDFTTVGPERTAFDPGARFASGDTQVGWKAHVIGDGLNDHIVMASAIIPGDKGQSRYAATVIESDEPRLERFLFDGTQRIALYVNGQLVAHSMQEEGRSKTEVDRQVVVAPLVKGRNTVVVMAASDGKGQATFTLRHEPGDLRYRIALLKRLAIEFPEDTEAVLADLQESARLWENLGFIGEAAKTSGEIAALAEAPRDQAETALFEQIRLHTSLRDKSSIDGDIEAIKALWSGDTEATPLTVLQRTAKLWQRLDQPDKALASLSEAAKLASHDDEQSAVLGLERLRLISANHDPAAICSGMRDVANALPATSALRALLCSEIADRMLAESLPIGVKGDTVWVEDSVPVGGVLHSAGGDAWTWVSNPTPYSGALCQQSSIGNDTHQHYFADATQTLAVKAGDVLFAYVYLDPAHPPSQVMLQWSDGSWEHRAYWGANSLPWGTDNTPARHAMGALPAVGRWLRLEVPASVVGLEGRVLNGMAFSLFGGRAWFDYAGKGRSAATAPAITAPPVWDKSNGELAIALASSNPRALRRAAGVALAAQQPALWLKALAAIAALPTAGSFDAPLVTLAEALEASGDTKGAIQAYRQAFAQWSGSEAPSGQGNEALNGLRSGLIRANLASSPTGVRLLSAADKAPASDHPDSGIAGVIRQALAQPDQRDAIATSLKEVISAAYQADRIPEAGTLVRLLLSTFSDRREQGCEVARLFISEKNLMTRDPATARQALLWMEGNAPLQSRGKETTQWIGRVRKEVAQGLTQLGDYDNAVDVVHAAMWSGFDTLSQCQLRMTLGHIYRSGGYPERASRFYKSVQDTEGIAQIDAAMTNQARTAITELRAYSKVNPVNLITFDTANAVRSVDLLAESKDYEGTISAAQKIALANPGSAVPRPGSRAQGLVSWYADHLRRVPAAEIAAYRAGLGNVVAQQLADAVARDDLDALERLAKEHPVFPETAEALARCAQRYLAIGADSLAAATVDRLMREFNMGEPVRGELLAAGLRAAVRVGDHAIFASLGKEFASTPKPLVDGVSVDAQAWLAETGKPLSLQSADPVPAAAIGAAAVALAPEQLRDIRRFVTEGQRTVHVVPSSGIGSGFAYVSSGVDGVLLDLTSGALCWRIANDRMPITGSIDRGFGGLPEAGAILAGGRCIARARREGRWCMEARDPANGTLVWSSEMVPELIGWGVCSSPASDGARAIAVFGVGDRLTLAAFSLSDGHLAWITPLTTLSTDLGLNSSIRTDRIQSVGAGWLFELAAPTIVGREGYIATDSGAVLSFDCGSGSLRWETAYSRVPTFRFEGAHVTAERIRRPPSRVLVGAESLVVLPRNALGLISLSRSDGALRWSRDFPGGRALTGLGLTAQGERIVMQGEDVQGLDGATGRTVWRWQPRDGVTIGSGAVGATSVAIATAGSLHRLNLATGALLGSKTWKELGVVGSAPGNLRWSGDRLVATGNGGIAILAPAVKPAAGLPALAPTVIRSGREIIPTTGITPAAPGAPLTLAWRLPCADIISVNRINDRELILHTRESVSRVDVTVPAVVWTTAIPSDTKRILVDRDAIVVVGTATLMLLGSDDGAVRWCEQASGVNPLSEEGLEYESNSTVVLGETTVLTYLPMKYRVDFLEIRDRKTGKRLPSIVLEEFDDSQYRMGVRMIGAGEQAGKVCAIFFGIGPTSGKAVVQVHDLATGKMIAKNNTLPCYKDPQLWSTGTLLPDGTHIMVSGSVTAVVEVATGDTRVLGFDLPPQIWAGRVGDLVIFSGLEPKIQWGRSSTLWNPASDKPLFQDLYDDYGGHYYSAAGDRMVRGMSAHDGRMGILCKARGGEQLWLTPANGDLGEYAYMHILVHDSHIYTLVDNKFGYRHVDGQHFEIYNLSDGKRLSSLVVPGTAVAVPGGFQVIQNTWVLACDKQLIGLMPAAPEVVTKLPSDTSVPSAQAYLRGLMRMPSAEWASILPLSAARAKLSDPAELLRWKAKQPLLGRDVNGFAGTAPDPAARDRRLAALAATWSSEWSKMPSLELGQETVRLGTPAAAKVYTAYEAAGLCIAVEISDSTPHPRPRGGSPWSGDGVVVGLVSSPGHTVIALHDSDGLPQVDLVAGAWASDPAQSGKPLVHVLRGSGRQVYQVVIPWPLIFQINRWQPSGMGIAIIDRAATGAMGVRAWGAGLFDGVSPRTWPFIHILSDK